MRKAKQKQLVSTCKYKDDSDIDLDGDDSWVIVKKQRVTILIPPLPNGRKSVTKKPKPARNKPESAPIVAVNAQASEPIEISKRLPSVDEQEKVMPVARNGGIKTLTKIPAKNISASHKPPSIFVETVKGRSDPVRAFKSHNTLGLSHISKSIERPRLCYRHQHFIDGSTVLNQRLRASLLEKKLQKAGGLSKWLSSIGLGQFAEMFQGHVTKFQLVSLTMEKLKDMGANAVGPRRKLMHAIDCICQPYCYGGQ